MARSSLRKEGSCTGAPVGGLSIATGAGAGSRVTDGVPDGVGVDAVDRVVVGRSSDEGVPHPATDTPTATSRATTAAGPGAGRRAWRLALIGRVCHPTVDARGWVTC